MIPDFQSIMLPYLDSIADGRNYSVEDTNATLAGHFSLTEEDLNQVLPSGTQKTFFNRIAWAKYHLKLAGLIENPGRGVVRITPEGKRYLESRPSELNVKILRNIPVYSEKMAGFKITPDHLSVPENDMVSESQTPEELLENSYFNLRKSLASEILSKVKKCSSSFFENLVVELLVKMGYGAASKMPANRWERAGMKELTESLRKTG